MRSYVRDNTRLLLTYPGLSDLRKNVTQTLYPSIDGLCVNIESINSFGGLLGIEVEVRVEHISIKQRPSGCNAQVVRKLAFPFL
jgi:hypothetical protein